MTELARFWCFSSPFDGSLNVCAQLQFERSQRRRYFWFSARSGEELAWSGQHVLFSFETLEYE